MLRLLEVLDKRRARRLEEAAGEIARSLRTYVAAGVALPVVAAMSRAEARGYIRGKATPLVVSAVDALDCRRTADAATRLTLIDLATQRVAHLVLTEIERRLSPGRTLRRAA